MDFRHEFAAYACPLINPPAQRHLFQNKLHNLQLAIARMQGLVLPPGGAFSFWEYAHEPSVAHGYREGAMFINQRVVSSVGGGLCQLSGLLYNLALLSGCRIVERHNHSIDAYGEARYIPLGRDATVAFGRKDLRFENPHPQAIRFELAVDEQQARGRVLGTAPLDTRIAIHTELLAEIPSPRRLGHDVGLARGEERVEPGLTGKRVKAWRVSTGPGGEARIDCASIDHYHATPTVVYRRHGWPVAWLVRLARLVRR